MDYKIIADSCCDLNDELAKELNVTHVPFQITIEKSTFVDDKNCKLDRLIKEMKASKRAPSTACPSPEEFCAKFMENAVNFCITISGSLSGTYNSAMVGREMALAKDPSKFIHVFNSMSATAGETLVAYKIHEVAEQESQPAAVVEKIEKMIAGMKTFFILESLDNLMKNGRLTKIVGHLATILSIRPIMGADGHGEIELFEKPRGEERAFRRLCEMIGEQCSDISQRVLSITHCNAEEKALRLKKMVEETYDFKKIFICPTRGLATVYANVGGVVIAF